MAKENTAFENDDFEDDSEDTQKDRYLTFRLEREEYGIDIHYVTEVIGLQTITYVPDMPEYVKGVINLRGQVIPVMDVRTRFHMPALAYHDRTCVIVVNINTTAVGLVVDEVHEVLDIPAGQIDPPPSIRKKLSSHFISGLGKVKDTVIILLDVQKLLFDEDLEKISTLH